MLRRHHVPLLRVLDPLTGQVIRSSKATTVRYERDRPGELVHVDVKKIGRIPDGGGWRAHGRSESVRGRGNGYDYVHSMVDDHSRLAYSEILTDEKGPTCAAFIQRAAARFAEQGIPVIERVITDNHLSYRKSNDVKAVIAALGATHKFIRPHCPWQNGKVERFNRTLSIEWAYRQVFTSNTDRANALAVDSSSSTTLDDVTPPWADSHQSAACHQRDGRVHLELRDVPFPSPAVVAATKAEQQRHSGTEPVDDGGGVALVLRQARHADVGEADFSAERPTGMDLRLSCNLPFIAPAIDNEPYVQ